MEDLPAKTNKLPLAYYYGFKLIVLMVGCVIMYAGYKLFRLGIAGDIRISLEFEKIKGKLINGSPGAVVFIGGFLIALRAAWIGIRFAKARDATNQRPATQR